MSNVVAIRPGAEPGEEERYRWDRSRGEAVRPFRLWDCSNKCNVRWRYYIHKKGAHDAALLEIRWTKQIGLTIEVYDCRTMRVFAQYTRTPTSLKITEF